MPGKKDSKDKKLEEMETELTEAHRMIGQYRLNQVASDQMSFRVHMINQLAEIKESLARLKESVDSLEEEIEEEEEDEEEDDED